MSKKTKNVYDESSIKVLKGLDSIRKKPSLYIGPVDSHGIFTIVREVMDNAVDEFYAGRNDSMIVDIQKNLVTIHDNGQGIPVGEHATEGVSTLEVVVSHIHAGGKLEANDAYSNTRGTHGIGLSAVCALSESFRVYTNRRKQWWTIGYEKGVKTDDFRSATKKEIRSLAIYDKGTIVQFIPDKTIFDKGSRLDKKLVLEWAETTAYLSAGFNIQVRANGKEEEFQFDNGVRDWMDSVIEGLECGLINEEPIQIHTDNLELCLAFTDVDGDRLEGYTNGLFQVDDGLHVSTTRSLLYKTIQPYVGKKDKFTREDLCDGLIGLINFKIDSPRFSSQTKEKLADTRFDELCKTAIEKGLSAYWKANKELAKKICARATNLRGAREKFTIEKKALQALKKRQKETNKLPTKLSSVTGIKPHERELYTVEGDSASGCFIGNTEVKLANGETITFEKLVSEHQKGVVYTGLCYQDGQVLEAKLIDPRITKYADELVEVELEDGSVVQCTPEHLWLTDQGWVQAQDLSEDHEIISAS